VTVADQAGEPTGLWPCDIDVLLRLPGLERVDVVATEETLAAGFHERLFDALPGIEECRPRDLDEPPPVLVAPPHGSGRLHFVVRDREAELADVKTRIGPASRRSFTSGRCRICISRSSSSAMPACHSRRGCAPTRSRAVRGGLALLLEAVALADDTAARDALVRSPHLRFTADEEAMLPEVLRGMSGEAPVAQHLDGLMAFLDAHDARRGDPRTEDAQGSETMRASWDARRHRARGAIFATLRRLRDAHRRHDDPVASAGEAAGVIRRWIEGQTFAPQGGSGDLHLVDVVAARFGSFDGVHLLGLADGEWPEPAGRTVLYPGWLLRDLGWPPDAPRQAMARPPSSTCYGSPRARPRSPRSCSSTMPS